MRKKVEIEMRLHALSLAKLRYRHHIRQTIRIVFWLVMAGLVCIGAYSAMTEYQGAAAAIKKAETDRQEVLDILAGRIAMRTEGKEYYEFAEVKWHLAKEGGK